MRTEHVTTRPFPTVLSPPADRAAQPRGMPQPNENYRAAFTDGTTTVMAAISALESMEHAVARGAVKRGNVDRERAHERAVNAAERARDASRRRGLFSFIPREIVPVLAAAATVATAGAGTGVALAVTAVALSGSGELVRKTKCLDGAFGRGASNRAALGAQIGSAALTAGASLVGGAPALGSAVQTAGRAAGGGTAIVNGTHAAEGAIATKRQADAEFEGAVARRDAEAVKPRQNAALEQLQAVSTNLRKAREALMDFAAEYDRSNAVGLAQRG